MKKIYSTFVLMVLISASYAQCVADSAANIVAFSYGGKIYEIVKETKNWTDAAACAVERGGILIEIDDQAEQDTVFSSINTASITASNTVAPDGGGASYLWIGGNDIATEGDWIWDGDNTGTSVQFWQGTSTGSPIGGLYNNWGNEPDDFNGQDALGLAFTDWPLGVAGQWNDVDETNSLYFIIEHPANSNNIEEEPITKFAVFPNPSSDEITIELPGIFDIQNEHKIYIYDNLGKLVETVYIDGEIMKVNTSVYPNGEYHVFVNKTFVKDFIVQH